MFYELRMLFERTAEKPSLPQFVKKIILGIVSFTLKLAPPQLPPSPQQQHQQ